MQKNFSKRLKQKNISGIITMFLIGFLLNISNINAQNKSNDIRDAVRDLQIEKLSPVFNDMVEVVIKGQSNVSSKLQTQNILSDFFKKSRPSSVTISDNQQSGNVLQITLQINSSGQSIQMKVILQDNLITKIQID